LSRRLGHLSRWLDAAGIARPDKVTLGLVEKYKEDERARGIKDRTINRYLDSWKKAMKLAVDEGVAPPRVLTYFRKLKEPQHEPHQRGLTMDVIDATLKAVDDERYFWLFRLVAGTGIRDDEARHVDDAWVREGAMAVTPLLPGTCACHPRGWTTKNFRYRVIPASADTTEAARAYASVKHSMNLDSKKVWKELDRAKVAAGTNEWPWSMHELRRAWASHMLAAGHKLQDISRWLGHADIKTTMRYLRIVEDSMPDPTELPI
jgi:site-specific recombinase XerD